MKKRAANTVRDYWRDEAGLATIEYALLLALIVGVAIAAWTGLGTGVNSSVDESSSQMLNS